MTESDIELPESGGSSAPPLQAAKPQSPTEPAATAATPPPVNPQPFGSFGSTRGSGLARGKRATAAAPSRTTPGGDYKPTAVEVIVPRHEYKNPFEPEPTVAGDSSAALSHHGETAAKAPAMGATEESAPPAKTVAIPPLPPADQPRREQTPAAHSHAAAPLFPLQTSGPAPEAAGNVVESDPAKSELNILPPAEARKVPVHWENPAVRQKAPAPDYPPPAPRDERRERRSNYRSDSYQGADTGRASPHTEAEPKRGGFLAWLKGLFGGKPAPAAAPDERRPESEAGRDPSHQHRRRRRGGRGHHRSDRGDYTGQSRSSAAGEPHHYRGGDQPRDDRPGDGRPNGGRSGDQHGDRNGGHRRRHRGGQGRNRDERGGPRPEGQQGGGFI